MMADIYVGNTDNDWFEFLSLLSDVDEVNFWKPSPGNFNVIQEGERFAFRLKHPRNKIGGFGTLAKSSALPIQVAWEAFGTKNGVPSLSAFVAAISKFRVSERVTPSTFIVCRILVEPVFLPPHLWFDVPSSWARSIVQGKTYSGLSEEGAALWNNLEAGAVASSNLATLGFGEREQARFGEPMQITPASAKAHSEWRSPNSTIANAR